MLTAVSTSLLINVSWGDGASAAAAPPAKRQITAKLNKDAQLTIALFFISGPLLKVRFKT
jgi:hypothetical protein